MWSLVVERLVLVGLCTCIIGDASLSARVIYVDAAATGANDGSSWRNAYGSLQDALVAASSTQKPVEIRVAKGVYKPDQGAGIIPDDQTAAFHMLNDVTLKGGYAGSAAPDPNARDTSLFETILSGDLKGDDGTNWPDTKDNSCHVVMANLTNASAIIDGFTISGGGSGWGKCGDDYGGETGITIDGGSPQIRACHFVANQAYGLSVRRAAHPAVTACTFGTGGQLLSLGSALALTDCTFIDSQMTSDEGSRSSLTNCTFEQSNLEGRNGSRLTLTNCVFRDSDRSAMDIRDCNSILTGCLFERNRRAHAPGYAIESHRGILSLEDCRFVENNAPTIHSESETSLHRCSFVANSGREAGAISVWGSLILRDCEFIGNSSQISAGAIHVSGEQLMATGCIFAGNSTKGFMPGAVFSNTVLTQLSNCTFTGNFGTPSVMECWGAPAELKDCIVWNSPDPFTHSPSELPRIKVAYSDVQGGHPGEGNIDVDPCFVQPGYWADANDPNVELDPSNPKAVWVNGDYHLKSQAGHWDRGAETWIRDDVTSVCIDAGDPNAPIGSEPFPNGAVVNLGAYGGTTEASKSYFGEPVCETEIPGDVNGDCRVDATDAHIVTLHLPMQAANMINAPPTVTITLPQDGESFDYPTWIDVWANAADSDGLVLGVKFVTMFEGPGKHTGATYMDTDPSDGWRYDWYWWRTTGVPFQGTYIIWAEAMDNEGEIGVSPKIKVTLHVDN